MLWLVCTLLYFRPLLTADSYQLEDRKAIRIFTLRSERIVLFDHYYDALFIYVLDYLILSSVFILFLLLSLRCWTVLTKKKIDRDVYVNVLYISLSICSVILGFMTQYVPIGFLGRPPEWLIYPLIIAEYILLSIILSAPNRWVGLNLIKAWEYGLWKDIPDVKTRPLRLFVALTFIVFVLPPALSVFLTVILVWALVFKLHPDGLQDMLVAAAKVAQTQAKFGYTNTMGEIYNTVEVGTLNAPAEMYFFLYSHTLSITEVLWVNLFAIVCYMWLLKIIFLIIIARDPHNRLLGDISGVPNEPEKNQWINKN